MAEVSVSRLQRLVQLHRRQAPGAHELLEVLREDHGDEVCELLGLRPCVLSVDQVVARVEELTLRAKDERRRVARERAEELALRVGACAEHLPDGSISLPIDPFCRMADAGGFAQARLRERDRDGVVDLCIVRQFLKNCRTATLRQVRLTASHLVMTYGTRIGSGRLALVVGRPSTLDDAVLVDLVFKPRKAQLPRRTGFLAHLERALQEAFG